MNGLARAGACAFLLLLTACGTLQVTVEGAATPGLVTSATVEALEAQNAHLQTQVALLSTSARAPESPAAPTKPAGTAAAPTAPPPAATRITFLNGATVGMVSAPIGPGAIQTFVLQVFQAQPMYVYVGSPGNDVTLSISRQDGTSILGEAAHQLSWQGALPRTENYYLAVHGGATIENFSLRVTVPSRIQFDPGADTAVISGQTVAGYEVSYTLMASKGQKMSVRLDSLSGPASLSIYGFTDGLQYLRSSAGQTSYQFVLPSSQDYIVVVVPQAEKVVSYNLTVTVQ